MTDRKRGFITPLRVESVDARWWRILERFRFVGYQDPPDTFDVEPGEMTDFATVPWWTQFILPRTGTWTKAAVLHDMMCRVLKEYYRLKKIYEQLISEGIARESLVRPKPPKFTSVDADALFRKNAKEGGTDPIRAELLWFGVRCGSLWDAHRRDEWLSTLPRFAFDLLWILAALALILGGISWLWPW